jgi:hypothetical protein
MDIYLIDRASAEGQAREEMIDSLLITAEQKAREALGVSLSHESPH